MTYYSQIFEEAIGNYGIISSARAREIGIPSIELVKLAKRGRLRRLGYGVYKLVHYSPAPRRTRRSWSAADKTAAQRNKRKDVIGQSECNYNHFLSSQQPRSNHNTTILRVESKNDSDSTILHP